MASITLLGTGSPLPDPHRAGPATLVEIGGERFLIDAGRGVLMRLAAAGVAPAQLTAVLLTHLHSDHITDVNDVITSVWISTFVPTPLRIVGPPGTAAVVGHLIAALGPDIAYRIAHHDDLEQPPLVEVTEISDGAVDRAGWPGATRITVAPTDHRPVEPSIAFRLEAAATDPGSSGATSVVLAGDTVPCAGLDRLAAGATALVHTVIRKDIIANIPIARLQDTLGYHSSPEQAGDTAARAGVATLVLTHYVPAIAPGAGGEWRALAASRFAGRIELGDDLHRVAI